MDDIPHAPRCLPVVQCVELSLRTPFNITDESIFKPFPCWRDWCCDNSSGGSTLYGGWAKVSPYGSSDYFRMGDDSRCSFVYCCGRGNTKVDISDAWF